MKTSTANKRKRYIYIIAAAALILCAAVSCAAYIYSLYFKAAYTPINTPETADILNNPYCGWYDMYGYALNEGGENVFDSQTAEYIKKSSDTRLVLLQINLKNFSNRELPESALRQLDRIFTLWAESSHDIILRFLYDWDGLAMHTEPDDITFVKQHMRQTADIVNRHKNDIFLMQGIFVGSYAEMHNSKYMDAESMTSLALLLDSLIDEEIYLSVRTPAQLRTIFKTADVRNMSTDGRRLRFGLFNDGMLGSELDLGTYGSSGSSFSEENYSQKGDRAQEIAFQKKLCLLVPNGGEVVSDNEYNDIENAAKELSDMHVSYLNRAYDPAVISKWKTQVYNASGQSSVYDGLSGLDYISAHLGYRFVIDNSSFTYSAFKSGGLLKIYIKNDGFAPSYRNFRVTVSVEKNGAYAVQASDGGEPSGSSDGNVISFDLTDDFHTSEWYPGETAELAVSIPVSELKEGSFTVYLNMTDAVSDETILFANDAELGEYGYCLGTLNIGK